MENRWVLTVFDEDSGTESNIDFMAESKGEAGDIARQLFEAFPTYYGRDGYWEPVGFRRLNTKQYWNLPKMRSGRLVGDPQGKGMYAGWAALDPDMLWDILQQKPKYFAEW